MGQAKIKPTKNGPFIAENIKKFLNSRGEEIPTKESMALCRCGKSGDKPFCDGTHATVGFKDNKKAGRVPDRKKDYVGKDITIHDNRGVCAHAAFCTDNSPQVFDNKKSPWIDPDGEPVDDSAKTIRTCPSGALSYTKGKETWVGDEREASIKIFKDGPHCVEGAVEFEDEEGNKPHLGEHYTLCRCGYSKNKPFCDGSHFSAKFVDEKN